MSGVAHAFPPSANHLLYRKKLLTIWNEFHEIATSSGFLSSYSLETSCHAFGLYWHMLRNRSCIDRLPSPCESIGRNWRNSLKFIVEGLSAQLYRATAFYAVGCRFKTCKDRYIFKMSHWNSLVFDRRAWPSYQKILQHCREEFIINALRLNAHCRSDVSVIK